MAESPKKDKAEHTRLVKRPFLEAKMCACDLNALVILSNFEYRILNGDGSHSKTSKRGQNG